MPASKPRLAVVVANAITGDSRVQKVALTAAAAGWDVLLIGRSLSDQPEHSWMGPVKVLRVPVGMQITRSEEQRRRREARPVLARPGLANRVDIERYRARVEARARQRDERIAHAGGIGQFLLRAQGKVERTAAARRIDAAARAQDDPELLTRVTGDWRRDVPNILDLDRAMGPAIEQFDPDVIHANDITAMYTAAVVAARLTYAGKPTRWLYDAHEYVEGVDWPTERLMSGYPMLEREVVTRADAVSTVSPEIADLLREVLHLPETPLVVRNTPIRAAVGQTSVRTVREVAGLGPAVPLLVYSGYIQTERGLDTAIAALPDLPEVHLAIVANQDNKQVRELLQLAASAGVIDRVHIVPYVAQHEVADYLSSADAGIICSKRTINYELSLPTKFAEYLHAGLPTVVSDVKTLSAYVREHGVGEVFTSGEPASFREAAAKVLAAPGDYTARITEEVLTELSWEAQADGLLELYRRLAPSPPVLEPVPTTSWDFAERPRRPEHAGRGHVEAAGSAGTAGSGTGVPWREWTRSTPVRLGLGSANYAGQLSAIAQAVTDRREDVSAEVTMTTTSASFGYPADVYVRQGSLDRLEVQVSSLRRVLPRYSHVVSDAFRPVFGHLNGTDISGDVPALRAAGIKLAVLVHGTEIRHPLQHMERNPHSHFFDVPTPEHLGELVTLTERNHRIAAEADYPIYVTTPDLLEDLPQATWLPLAVDVAAWATDQPVMERERPIVLHAPSKRWTKGTDRFLAALRALEEKGLITLDLVEGLPWPEMRRRVQAADIVVDQVAVGAYGAFACEAMAAGKPVLGYLSDRAIEVIGEVPPIVNTTGAGVAAEIERLVADRAEARRIAAASLDYARRFHDGSRTAAVLDDFLT